MRCYSWHNRTKYIYIFFLVSQNDLKLHILKFTVNTRGQSEWGKRVSSVCFKLVYYWIYSRQIAAALFLHSTGTQNLHAHKTTFPVAIWKACACVCAKSGRVCVELPLYNVQDSLYSPATSRIWLMTCEASQVCMGVNSTASLKVTNTRCCSTPVSSALGDVDQFLNAARVGQGLGVLHVFAGDLVQGATDGSHGLVRQQGGVPPGETVDQVPHRILTWERGGGTQCDFTAQLWTEAYAETHRD